MGTPPRHRYLGAPWPWRIGEQRGMSSMAEMLEGGGDGGAGVRFSLRFDPMRAGFDRTLVSFPVSALISRLLGWSNNSSQGRSLESVVVVAAAVALYFAALFLSDQQPRRRRLTASAMARPNSAARPRALPAPGDGLRILSSNDESLENVIHGASIGAGEDEPVLVARVQARPPYAAVASADGETEDGQSENEPPEEVERFKELWLSLLEREQRLELRLMELDSLREQEATVRELESRVTVAAAEARLLELKVAALQEENERLRAQASELDAVRAELGRAREKLRALKARVEGEQEEARREAAALRERVTELEKNGEERDRALAEEAASMRKANTGLAEENRELALRLQDAEQVASSVNLVLEEEDMVDEADELRETNERLTRQIEQLHGDHCKHVEELVYLKWVNACLRHELRGNEDQHPSSGGQQDHAGAPSSAVDLSKSMSYRSSEKAKELMLRYGSLGLEGFDPALFSPLNESLYGGDGQDQDHQQRGDYHVVAVAAAAPEKRAGHGKLKFLRNINKLLAGSSSSRKGHGHGHEHKGKKKAPAAHDEHFEKAIRWLSSHDAGDSSYESTPLSSCQRTPLSSVTTVDSHARGERGGGRETAAEPAAASRLPEEEEAKLARSKSDAGASYGREASRYHALRPDHPAGVGPHHALQAPEKPRRYSEELRSS